MLAHALRWVETQKHMVNHPSAPPASSHLPKPGSRSQGHPPTSGEFSETDAEGTVESQMAKLEAQLRDLRRQQALERKDPSMKVDDNSPTEKKNKTT